MQRAHLTQSFCPAGWNFLCDRWFWGGVLRFAWLWRTRRRTPLKRQLSVNIVIGGNALTQEADLKYVLQEGSPPAGLWGIIFLTLSAAIFFCVLGALWALTQPHKTLAFGEGDALRVAAAAP
jgi:hypothetical protein